jgi:O-antigen/teichoic acid export membrane protein
MSEIDQLVEPGPATLDSGPPVRFGLLRGAFSSVREKWRSKEHRAPVFFTASSILLSVAQLLSGVVIVHYIGPREMGLWASVSLALTYAFFALAGVQNGLSRELPYYLGANNEGMARRLAATTLFYTAGGCLLALFAGAGAVALLIEKHSDSKLTYAVAAVTLLVMFKFYQNYLFVTFRSKNSFMDLARVQVWQAALMVLALPLLLLRYDGMLLRYVLVAGLGLYLMHRARPMAVVPSWKMDSFSLLLKTGIPIFATDYISNCAGTLDKVALLKFGGIEQVGLYALAISAYAAFQVVPQSIAHYVYPRMSHHYGRTNNPHVLWGMAWKTSLIVVGSMIPIAVVGCWLLPTAVRFLFPKYVAGTHAAEIALFTAVAYGATMGANALASLKAWSYLFAYQLSYAGLLAVAPFMAVRLFSSPLDGVAYGMLGANLVSAILALGITFAATHRKSGNTLGGDPAAPWSSIESEVEIDKAATVVR